METADIKKLAELARIEINEQDMVDLKTDFDAILAYMDQIAEVATEEVQTPVSEHRNVLREDEDPHEKDTHTQDLLEEAPEAKEGYIKVKRILNN